MSIYYFVDRNREFEKGKTIEEHKVLGVDPSKRKISSADLGPLVDEYKEGLTYHGVQYLTPPLSSNHITEWILETVRLDCYPENPSRFKSVFVFNSVDDAERFINEFDQSGGPSIIWRVESIDGHIFKADIGYLHSTSSFPLLYDSAHKYWSQKETGNPLWEYFLKPPVEITKKIKEK